VRSGFDTAEGREGSNPWRRRRALVAAVLAVLALAIVACGDDDDSSSGGDGGSSTSGSSDSGGGEEKVNAQLLNSFMGNTWRPVMMRSAELLATRAPLDARIEELKLVTSDNTAAAQNAALNNMLLDPPDMVLIDASSPTASNQTIQKVCDAGSVVISFDNPVTAPCAWKILVDFKTMGVIYAKWMAEVLDGKGKVFLDMGLPGTSTSEEFGASALDTLAAEAPDIEVERYYGKFAAGAEQSGVANLVSANKDVAGIISFAYGAPAQQALEKAGVDPVPMTTFSYNEGMIWCNDHDVPCLLGSSPAYISGEAMRLGLDVIDGKKTGEPTTVFFASPFFLKGTDVQPDTDAEVYPVEDYVEPDLDPGTTIPLSPEWSDPLLTPEEVLEPPNIG
jgi:ribose transport system substrate-binding protein